MTAIDDITYKLLIWVKRYHQQYNCMPTVQQMGRYLDEPTYKVSLYTRRLVAAGELVRKGAGRTAFFELPVPGAKSEGDGGLWQERCEAALKVLEGYQDLAEWDPRRKLVERLTAALTMKGENSGQSIGSGSVVHSNRAGDEGEALEDWEEGEGN